MYNTILLSYRYVDIDTTVDPIVDIPDILFPTKMRSIRKISNTSKAPAPAAGVPW